MFFKLALALLGLVLAFLAPALYTFFIRGNVFKDVPPLNMELCKPMKLHTGQEATASSTKQAALLADRCEDIALYRPLQLAILSCGSHEARLRWFPPMARLDTSSDHNDQPLLLDLQTGQITAMRMDGWNASLDFRPHGVSMYVPPDLRKEPFVTVAFVNHRRDWSVIELFHWKPGTTHLTWRDTIKNKFITTPNDLTMMSSEAFYVTNDHRHRLPGAWRTLEEYLQRPWSSVMYRNDRGKVSVAVEGLVYANGIASKQLRDGTVEIWVAASLEFCVKVYHQKQGGRVQSGALRHMYDVELDFVPDNLDIDTDGSVYVAGHPKVLNFIVERMHKESEWVRKAKAMFPAYSKVARIVNATGEQAFMGHPFKVEVLFVDPGKTFRAASVAVADRKQGRMWVGALASSGMGQCDLKKMKSVPLDLKK